MAKLRADIDLDLIRKAQEGNADSTALLAASIQPKVYAYIHRMTLNPGVAEDLSQDTMLRLVSNLRGLSFEDTPFFWAWVYKTALTRVQDHVRSEKLRQRSSVVMENRMKSQGWTDDGTELRNLEHKELLASVWKAMQRLSLRHRNVLTLRCLDELSYAQIATVIGGSELSARLLFLRAKRSLQRQLVRDGLNQSAILLSLALFAAATAHASQKTAGLVPVSAASFQSGAGIAALGMATSKTAAVAVCAIVGLAAVSNVAGRRMQSGLTLMDTTAETWVESEGFADPSRAWLVEDPDRRGFQFALGDPPMAVRPAGPPEHALVGKFSKDRPCVVLSPGQVAAVGFDRAVIDGPGPDILVAGWGCRCQRVILTDGAQARLVLPLPRCEGSHGQFAVLAIDLARLNVPFTVKAVAIQGSHVFTPRDSYRLAGIRARTAVPRTGE